MARIDPFKSVDHDLISFEWEVKNNHPMTAFLLTLPFNSKAQLVTFSIDFRERVCSQNNTYEI